MTAKTKDFLVTILPSVVAIVAIIASVCTTMSVNRTTVRLKQYEMTFELKRLNYANFMKGVLKAYDFSVNKDTENLNKTFQHMEDLYLDFEPIMSKKDREDFTKDISDYYGICMKYASRTNESYYVDELKFKLYEDEIHSILFKTFFGEESSGNIKFWKRDLPKDFNPAPGITP